MYQVGDHCSTQTPIPWLLCIWGLESIPGTYSGLQHCWRLISFFGFVVIFPTMCHMRQTEPPQSLNADLSCCAAAIIWEVTAPSFGGMRYCFTKDVVHLITFTSKTFMLVLQVCYCAFKSLFIYIKRGQKKIWDR